VRLIVVGAGVVGASCAYTASRLGAEVVLVDAALEGKATAAGAGIVICPWSSGLDDPVWHSFICAAAREYPALIESLAALGETDVGYRQVGALILAGPAEQPEAIRRTILAHWAGMPEIGDMQVLDGAEAQCLFPPLRRQPAVYISGAARVDGRLLSAALTRAAVRHGAVVREGHAQLTWRSGRATGVTVGGEVIEADAVVAATGAWTADLLRAAGISVAVTPQRGQIMHLSVAPADTRHWPIVQPGWTDHYLLAFDDARVVAGATRETGSGFDYRVTPAGLAEVLREALDVAPGLASAAYLETRVGFRPMGPDIRPLLGPVRSMDGLVVATGLGASGLTMGPYVGAIAAQTALGAPPAVDLAAFDPLRITPPG
jgi:D-amino-acid dehydrogenase